MARHAMARHEARTSPLPAKLGEVGASVASSGRGCDLGFGPRRLLLCLCPLPNVADGSIRPPPTASGEVTSIALFIALHIR